MYYFLYEVRCKQLTTELQQNYTMAKLQTQVNEAIRVVESEAEAREVPSIDVYIESRRCLPLNTRIYPQVLLDGLSPGSLNHNDTKFDGEIIYAEEMMTIVI